MYTVLKYPRSKVVYAHDTGRVIDEVNPSTWWWAWRAHFQLNIKYIILKIAYFFHKYYLLHILKDFDEKLHAMREFSQLIKKFIGVDDDPRTLVENYYNKVC